MKKRREWSPVAPHISITCISGEATSNIMATRSRSEWLKRTLDMIGEVGEEYKEWKPAMVAAQQAARENGLVWPEVHRMKWDNLRKCLGAGGQLAAALLRIAEEDQQNLLQDEGGFRCTCARIFPFEQHRDGHEKKHKREEKESQLRQRFGTKGINYDDPIEVIDVEEEAEDGEEKKKDKGAEPDGEEEVLDKETGRRRRRKSWEKEVHQEELRKRGQDETIQQEEGPPAKVPKVLETRVEEGAEDGEEKEENKGAEPEGEKEAHQQEAHQQEQKGRKLVVVFKEAKYPLLPEITLLMKDGGWQVGTVPEGGVFHKANVLRGDKLLAVNEVDVTKLVNPESLAKALSVFIGEVRVVVERGGGEAGKEDKRETSVTVQCQFCTTKVQIPKGKKGKSARDNLLRHMGQHYPGVENLEAEMFEGSTCKACGFVGLARRERLRHIMKHDPDYGQVVRRAVEEAVEKAFSDEEIGWRKFPCEFCKLSFQGYASMMTHISECHLRSWYLKNGATTVETFRQAKKEENASKLPSVKEAWKAFIFQVPRRNKEGKQDDHPTYICVQCDHRGALEVARAHLQEVHWKMEGEQCGKCRQTFPLAPSRRNRFHQKLFEHVSLCSAKRDQ